MITLAKTFKATLVALFLMTAATGFAQPSGPLNGIYSVGPSTFPPNDFESIAAACEYLNTKGVSGPVAFNIMPGVYNDPIELHSVQGTSATNTILFHPFGDSLAVTIKATTAFNINLDRYAVWLDHTNHVIIRNLNLMQDGAGGSTIVLENGSSNNKILFNNIYGRDINNELLGSNALNGVFIRSQQQSSNNIIRGNNIRGFATGIFVAIETLLLDSEISRNYIDKFVSNGIYFQGVSSNCKILDNRINANMEPVVPYEVVPSGYGVQVNGTLNNFEFSGNEIKGNFMYGVMLQGLGSKFSPNTYITNNMIAGGPSTAIGLAVDYSYNVHVYYNSVVIGSDNPVSYATEFTQDSMMWVMNNIFVANKGVPVTIDQRFFGQDFDTHFDFNNYFNHGDILMSGPDYPASVSTLADWQVKTGWDLHSINIDPEFIGPDDLHTRNPLLDGLAASVGYPEDDIDKEQRAELPDIGADETFLVAADAGLQEIVTDDLCSKASDVHVRIRNHSFNDLTSVTIQWSVNGVAQAPKSWTGNLAKGQVSDLVTIGSFSFVANTSYTIVARTENPNGTADLYTVNDEKTSTDVFSSIIGTYTIGQGGHFATIKEAMDLLNSRGICGPTTFNIKDGVYTEEQLVLKQIPGAGPGSRVIFQSQSRDRSKVTITFTGTVVTEDYVLKLDGTDFITLRDISIKSTGSLATAILFSDLIEHVMIDHCYFYAANPTGNPLLRTIEGYFSGFALKNSKLEGGDGGARLDSSPPAVFFTPEVDSIYYNEFIDQRSVALSINTDGKVLIEGNKVTAQNNFSIGMVTGSTNGSIVKNVVHAVSTGISVGGCGNLVANNFIMLTESAGTTGGGVGISIPFCTGASVFYNSILIKNKNAESIGITIGSDGEVNGTVKNNIVVIDGPGIPLRISGSINNLDSDHNDLVTKGNASVILNSDPYSTLTDWTTFSSNDTHSVSRDPNFVSPTDLHIQNKFLTGRGAPVAITTDIDNESRHVQYPTIGADEFGIPMLNDVALVSHDDTFLCDVTKALSATFMNNGILPITSFSFKLKVNGVEENKEWSGTLEPEQQTVLDLGIFETGIAYNIEIVGMEVNNVPDEDPGDNDLTMSFTLHKPVDLGQESIGTCSGVDAVLDAGPGYDTYIWSTSAETQTISADQSDEYTVTVKDENSCTSSDVVTVTVYLTEPVIVSSDANYVLCDGHPVTLDATPPAANAQFEWRHGNDILANDSGTLAVEDPGTYTVHMQLDGCEFTSEPVEVKAGVAPAKPTIEGRPDACEGEFVVLSGPIDAAWYIWSNSTTSSRSVAVNTSLIITLKVANTDGCLSPLSDPVETIIDPIPEKPVITVTGNLELCSGNSTQLTAPAGFPLYFWSNNSVEQHINVTEGGTYSVRLMGDNECLSLPSEPVTITVSPTPVAEITVVSNHLLSSEGERYEWIYNDTEVLDEASRTLRPAKSGNYKVTVFLGDCSATSDNVAYTVSGLFDSGEWKVYPNPAASKMTIIGSDVNGVKVTMEDGVGRTFTPRIMTISSDGISIDVSELSPGVYLLKIDKGDEVVRGKIVVAR